MGHIPSSKGRTLYDHVLQKLGQALRKWDSASVSVGYESEMTGLSQSEWALIQAYLRQDKQWLAGWQAAAAEAHRQQHKLKEQYLLSYPIDSGQKILSCAVCATEIAWPERSGFATCPVCGSDTLKAIIKFQGKTSGH